MKYYLLAGVVIFSGVVAVMLSTSVGKSPEANHFTAKSQIAEPETKVRPAYFEAMKMSPESAVEQRAPASTKK